MQGERGKNGEFGNPREKRQLLSRCPSPSYLAPSLPSSLPPLTSLLPDPSSLTIDLHGLRVPEALSLLHSLLALPPPSLPPSLRTFRLITGKGMHSKGGKARLGPAVLAALQRQEGEGGREGGKRKIRLSIDSLGGMVVVSWSSR